MILLLKILLISKSIFVILGIISLYRSMKAAIYFITLAAILLAITIIIMVMLQ